jgi:hypothetical protein
MIFEDDEERHEHKSSKIFKGFEELQEHEEE